MVKCAVILAAGMGTRLKQMGEHVPKGFLVLEEEVLIKRSIRLLKKYGIKKIFIGTGHQSHYYEALAREDDSIKCVYNSKYDVSGSLYTLFLMRDFLDDDFLLLESDLIYEEKALEVVLLNEHNNIVLASGWSDSGDEVYVGINNDLSLFQLSKDRTSVIDAYGEFVGINKISLNAFQDICRWASDEFLLKLKIEYEQSLIEVSKKHFLAVLKVSDLLWAEIDNEDHLNRCCQSIYPKIKNKEKYEKNCYSRNIVPIKRNILLNPGPATTTDSVKYAMVVPDICPREKEFGQIMKNVCHKLVSVVNGVNTHATVLFVGSGTGGVEATISSLVEDDKKVLIIVNGSYGRRMVDIARAYYREDQVVSYELPMTEIPDLNKIRNYLEHDKNISHLCVVHHETTTGIINPIEEITDLAHQYDVSTIVDAMSSYAGRDIDLSLHSHDFLISSSNKCIQGMAGIVFVICNKEKLERSNKIKAKNFYFNLFSQYEYLKKRGEMRFTPAVQIIYALDQALDELFLETKEKRFQRYKNCWNVLIEGLQELKLETLIPNEYQSHLLTAVVEPQCSGYAFDSFHDFLYDYGITIYPGKLEGMNTFRIANIGDITEKDMHYAMSKIKKYFENL